MVDREYDINNMVRRVKTSLGDTLSTYLYFADGEKHGVTTAPRYLYNGKEKQEFIHNTGSLLNAAGSATYTSNYIDYGARFYNPVTLRWTTQDPLAEKYMGYSPYNYCLNSPINFVDPNGMDNYRFDISSGTFHLMEKTDDEYDQVLDYKNKNGEYVAKTDKKGNFKVKIKNVEKGILHDNINFKQDNNTIEISNGSNNNLPSQSGFEHFLMDLADLIHKEIGSVYSTSKDKTQYFITVTAFEKNNDEFARIVIPFYFINNDQKRVALYPYEVIHTHLSNKENRTSASEIDRNSQLSLTSKEQWSHLQFTIITSAPFTRTPY